MPRMSTRALPIARARYHRPRSQRLFNYQLRSSNWPVHPERYPCLSDRQWNHLPLRSRSWPRTTNPPTKRPCRQRAARGPASRWERRWPTPYGARCWMRPIVPMDWTSTTHWPWPTAPWARSPEVKVGWMWPPTRGAVLGNCAWAPDWPSLRAPRTEPSVTGFSRFLVFLPVPSASHWPEPPLLGARPARLTAHPRPLTAHRRATRER